MIIQTDLEGYVIGYATKLADGVTIDGVEVEDVPEGFESLFSQYRLIDGHLVLQEGYISPQKRESIRVMRQRECFPVINRGVLWYRTLTDAQTRELDEWYTAWLNAPETGVMPDAPEWLDQ